MRPVSRSARRSGICEVPPTKRLVCAPPSDSASSSALTPHTCTLNKQVEQRHLHGGHRKYPHGADLRAASGRPGRVPGCRTTRRPSPGPTCRPQAPAMAPRQERSRPSGRSPAAPFPHRRARAHTWRESSPPKHFAGEFVAGFTLLELIEDFHAEVRGKAPACGGGCPRSTGLPARPARPVSAPRSGCARRPCRWPRG